MHEAYISLGSNLQQPFVQVCRAVKALHHLPACRVSSVSPWYRSFAVGPGNQPHYINAAMHLQTDLSPVDLLRSLQGIEYRQGRQRVIRYGARSLDLDLLLYDNLILNEPELKIPHPMILQRNFVIFPLYDVAPSLVLPQGGVLAQVRQQTSSADLSILHMGGICRLN